MDDNDEETSFRNATRNVTAESGDCSLQAGYLLSLALIDVVTVVMGQPMAARLLWITLTSKKSKDILNLNLALFHSVQYLISNVHLFVIFFLPHNQESLLRFVYVFVQIGGPMSLTFICVERYIAVIYPTSFPLLKKHRCRETCAASVWLFAVPPALVTVSDHQDISDATVKNLGLVSYGIMLFMIAIMMYSSISVARALKHSAVGKDVLHPVKRRAFITICVTSNTALFCYIPVSIMQRLKETDSARYSCNILPLSIFFLSAASVVHPLFYLSTQSKLCNFCKREKTTA